MSAVGNMSGIMIMPTTADSSPLSHDYYKRAVYRAAPHLFNVEMLPPTKIGSAHSYGMRVHPIRSDNASMKSSIMSSSYEIWRRWEDCLWFQDTLEMQYGVLSREKRQRLAHGKGVKKNGIYIHDRASSWESLPSGPDPKSVSKDIHKYLPKLTKRGTLFRPNAATIDQRQQELTDLVSAFLSSDLPVLVEELREDRTLRDFFGYWRRDHDLLLKRKPAKPSSPSSKKSRMSTREALSLYLSPSNASMPHLPPSPGLLHSPTPSVSSFAPGTMQPTPASSDSSSNLSTPDDALRQWSPTVIPPDRFSPSDPGVSPRGSSKFVPMRVTTVPPSNASASERSASGSVSAGPSRLRALSSPGKNRSFNVAEDFPLFLSSSSRDSVGSPRPTQSPAPRTTPQQVGGLEILSEDLELDTEPPLPSPMQRPRTQSLANMMNRNCILFDETTVPTDAEDSLTDTDDMHFSQHGHDSAPSLYGHEAEPGQDLSQDLAPNPGLSLSSSSATVSSASLVSRRSSWRTSPRSRPSSAGSGSVASGMDVDLSSFLGSSSSPQEYMTAPMRRHHVHSKASINTIATIDSAEAVIPMESRSPLAQHRGRPRSHSQPIPHAVDTNSWIELGDDFMDAYFGDAALGSHDEDEDDSGTVGPRSDRAMHGVDVPQTSMMDFPQTPMSPTMRMPTPEAQFAVRRQEIARGLSPGPGHLQFHLPFTPPATSGSEPDSDWPGEDTQIVVKAALGDAIVSFRLPRVLPFADARARIADKFARTEGRPLPAGFVLAFVPPVLVAPGALRETRVRASRLSVGSSESARQAMVIASDEDWAVAVATCGPKLVLRVSEA